jgi:competence protein ComEC
MALSAAAGAWWAGGPSPFVGVACTALALARGRPALLCVAVCVLTAGLGAAAEHGMRPVAPRSFSGTALLVRDPEPLDGGGVSVEARLDDGTHVEMQAMGSVLAALRDRQGGQSVTVTGRLRGPPAGVDALAVRHIRGRLDVERVDSWSPGGPIARAANWLRSLLADGASVLPERQRPLFLGFVLGDTRGQPVDIADDFSGSGLTHLLAVSGENVAFVLIAASPLLLRLRLGLRTLVTILLIAFFALVTRFEPSVLRASAMAGLAACAVGLGRTTSGVRLLALAVTGLVVCDPFLVRSVGFELSVAASASILLLGPRIAAAVPGPRPLAGAVAVSVAAQVGVAPILVVVFGGVPVASVPANVFAAPAAGPVMVWGLTAGLAAGVFGGAVAGVLHWPTGLLVGWLEFVAHTMSELPLGELRGGEVVAIAALAALGVVSVRGHRPKLRWLALAAVMIVAFTPAWRLRSPPPLTTEVASGVTLWRAGAGAVLEVSGNPDAADAVQGLRRAGVSSLTLVVAPRWNATVEDTLTVIAHRAPWHMLLTPARVGAFPDAVVPAASLAFDAGGLRVDVTRHGTSLDVEIAARGPPG